MPLVTILIQVWFVFACPQMQTVQVTVEHFDESGQVPSELFSQTAVPVAQNEQIDPQPQGLYLDPKTIGMLLMCISLGYCPDPGTPIEWGWR